ncbi:hypothetical protein QVD17_20331 [Tagetes erecta]|uniref:Uncharacterized protein n=1 Tax=Tagetes erecta TaxID=13708 RepID=A0AAD8KLJ4_TARER|nr:hypothetical protein QVD17_20331 [Tagetes erecta]
MKLLFSSSSSNLLIDIIRFFSLNSNLPTSPDRKRCVGSQQLMLANGTLLQMGGDGAGIKKIQTLSLPTWKEMKDIELAEARCLVHFQFLEDTRNKEADTLYLFVCGGAEFGALICWSSFVAMNEETRYSHDHLVTPLYRPS